MVRWRRRALWLGSLRRTSPVSDHWGADRGMPVDRYYIEQFLAGCSGDIRGRVLEVMDSRYTDRFGSGVERSDVLDIDSTNPRASLVADLTRATDVPSDAFDCFILTQTLQFIYDYPAAVRECHRVLRPGGVLLATVPSVSRLDLKAGREGDFWRFTADSCERIFEAVFPAESVRVHAYGNVLAAVAFLVGLAREDLSTAELDDVDARFPVLIAIRAVKG